MKPITDRLTPTVKWILIADVVIFLFYVVVRESRAFMQTHLALGPRFFAGELWQPLSSLFVHIDPLGFVLTMVGFWFIGGHMERTQGRRRFATLFFGAGMLANLAIAGTYRLLGAGPIPFTDGCFLAVTALFVAFGRLFGRQSAQFWPFPIAVQARYLVLILVGFQAIASLSRSDWPALAGLAVAVLVGFFGAAPGGLTSIRTALAQARDIARARRLRRRFGVIEGGERRPKKYVN